jgi:thiol-disulfide isomerase/thioredoxin
MRTLLKKILHRKLCLVFVSLSLLSPIAFSQKTGLGERKHNMPISQPINISDLRVKTLSGDDWIAKTQRGKFVVINFWATWCKPCVKEMPDFQSLSLRSDVSVLGLAYEEAENADLTAFLKKVKVNYPNAKVDVYAPLPQPLEAPRGLPTTLIFNRQGELLKKFLGPVTKADLEQVIDANSKP